MPYTGKGRGSYGGRDTAYRLRNARAIQRQQAATAPDTTPPPTGNFAINAISPISVVGNGQELTLQPTVINEAATPTWSFSGLPTDWTGDTATGLIQGTQTSVDQSTPLTASVTVTANDGVESVNETASITINPPPLALASMPAGTPILFIGSGQSNWVSTAQSAPAYADTPIANAVIQNSAGSFIPFEHNPGFSRPQDYFARDFEVQYPNLRLLVVEHGDGGNGFESGTGTFAVGGAARNTLFNFIENAWQRLRLGNVPFVVWGMFWIQGNADANNLAEAQAHGTQLPIFFDDIDALFGFHIPKVVARFWSVNYENPTTPQTPNVQEIRDDHEALSDAWTNLDDITNVAQGMGTDNVHYNQTGNQKNAARALAALNSLPAPTLIDPNQGIHIDGRDITDVNNLPAEITLVSPDSSVLLAPQNLVGMRIRRNNSPGVYGTYYLRATSPMSWDNAVVISMRTGTNAADQNVAGISQDPAAWDARTDNTTIVWRNNTGELMIDNTVVDTFAGAIAANQFIQLQFQRIDDDIRVEIFSLSIGTLEVFQSFARYFRNPLAPLATYTWVDGALTLTNPIPFLDAHGAGTDFRFLLFKEALKEVGA